MSFLAGFMSGIVVTVLIFVRIGWEILEARREEAEDEKAIRAPKPWMN